MANSQKLEITWHNKDKALIPTTRGRYGYTWVAPTDPRYCQTNFLEYGDVVRGVQRPKEEGRTYSERADLAPQDDNLLVLGESGDVLEALTRVPELADKYVGQVKCVYIDPPFNTAQTFANYEDNLEHSIWLTMMRDRLLHFKKLLADDGSIWVHLDDVENHRMRMLMDEVFGAANFVTEMTWEKTYSPRNDSKGIPAVTDVILVYRKTSAFVPNRLPRTEEMNSRYTNPDGDLRGPWANSDATASGAETHQGMVYAIQHPISGELLYPTRGRHWAQGQAEVLAEMRGYSERYDLVDLEDEDVRSELCGLTPDTVRKGVRAVVLTGDVEQGLRDGIARYEMGNWPRFWITNGGRGRFRYKSYLAEKPGKVPVNLLSYDDVGHTDTAAKEIRALFPGTTPFATPKPERLLERIIHIATNPGDIVLDVFAGSGTTAAVAQKMGRRWVTCELVEDTFNRFTRPRLEKVVRGEDMGGITVTKGERVDDTTGGLPEGLTPEDAQKLTSLLNKAIKDEPELKKSDDLRAVKQLVKTKKSPDTINWRGGGGFTVARLSEPCFDVDEDTGITILTEHATAANLARAVAAHLRFHMTPDHPVFAAKRANMHLSVTRQPVTHEYINEILGYVADGEAVTVAATSVSPEVAEYLVNRSPGSRVIAIPDGLFITTLSDKA